MGDLSIHRDGYAVIVNFEPTVGGYKWTAVVMYGSSLVDNWHGVMTFFQTEGRAPEDALQEILNARVGGLPR